MAIVNEDVEVIRMFLSNPRVNAGRIHRCLFWFDTLVTPFDVALRTLNTCVIGAFLECPRVILNDTVLTRASSPLAACLLIWPYYLSDADNSRFKDVFRTILYCPRVDVNARVTIFNASKRNSAVHKKEDAYSTLHLACSMNHVPAVKMLIDCERVDVNAKTANASGQTALHIAVIHERVPALRMLLACDRVDVNIQNDDPGVPALHYAVFQNEHIVRAFFECDRVDVDITNKKGHTALYYAVIRRGSATITRLIMTRSRDKEVTTSARQLGHDDDGLLSHFRKILVTGRIHPMKSF